MTTLNISQNSNTFRIELENNLYAEITFIKNNNSQLLIDGKLFEVSEGEDKNMLLSDANQTIFTFKLDYLWGGADLISKGTDTGYNIKGRWFKPGTRLIDENNKDLVIVKNTNNGYEATVEDDTLDKIMVVSTIYYHIYGSKMKQHAPL